MIDFEKRSIELFFKFIDEGGGSITVVNHIYFKYKISF